MLAQSKLSKVKIKIQQLTLIQHHHPLLGMWQKLKWGKKTKKLTHQKNFPLVLYIVGVEHAFQALRCSEESKMIA